MAEGSGEAKTSIDSLVELLHAKGRMELHAIATSLGVDVSIAESWAKVLEEGNMARIVNEVGKMYVEPVTMSKDQEQTVKVTIDTEKSTLLGATATEIAALETLSSQLTTLSSSAAQAERLFRERLPSLEVQLKKVNQIYSGLIAEDQRLEATGKKTEALYDSVNKRIDGLLQKIEAIDPSLEDVTRGEVARMREALGQAQEFEAQINLINRSKDKAMETIKKSMEVQVKALEKELNRAHYNVDAQLRTYEEQLRKSLASIREQYRNMNEPIKSSVQLKNEIQGAKKSLTDAKVQFNDEYARVRTVITDSENALTTEVNSMMSQLDQLKSAAGSSSQIYDNMQKTKNDIAEASRKVAALKADAAKIVADLNALDTTKAPIEAKLLTASNLKKRIKDLDKATREMKGSVDEFTESLSPKEEK